MTVRSWSSRGELGCTGGTGDIDGRRGVSSGVDGVVSDVGGARDAGGGETFRLPVVWGGLGGWGRFRGCSEGSGSASRRSSAVARSPEWDSAGNSGVVDEGVDDDVAATRRGSSWGTGVWDTSWGQQGCLGGLLDRRLVLLVGQGRSVE
jgi:hypothetical protein